MVHQVRAGTVLASGLTFDEYLAQFSGQFAEWVYGDVVAMAAISLKHDLLSQFFVLALRHYLAYRKVAQLRVAPTTMRLGDDLPAREPDLQIVLNAHADRITDTYVDGPADWVIEIVSPESSLRDRGDKFHEYEQGGVDEYWIVDPHREELLAYQLGEDGLYQPLPLDDGGHVTSATLPEFRLEVALLWQSPLPEAPEIAALVRQMLQA